MTVVVTGYEPFGDHERNPTRTIADRLDGATVASHSVVGSVLPVAFERASDELAALIDDYNPELVLCTGLAPGASGIRVERVAINVNNCMGVPDNDGATPRNERIVDGPDAYFTSIPVPGVVEALLDTGIPARLSNTAGTHLCNNALYSTSHIVETKNLDVAAGFLHVPYTPAQAAENARDEESVAGSNDVPPSLPVAHQVQATETAIETILNEE